MGDSARLFCIRLDSISFTQDYVDERAAVDRRGADVIDAGGISADVIDAGDVGELYRLLSARLQRIVRGGVRAPDPVIEDACQFAWSRLMDHRHRVRREAVLNWLTATAVHEAVKLLRRSRRELSLETVIEQGAEPSSRGGRAPHALAEQHERLRSLTLLPQRQQQALWLYGLGLSYDEIARRQGCTSRAVERRLQRARTRLRVDLGR